MNFYTPNGHAAYATQQPINSNNNNHHEQQQNALQAALQTFDQPPAPSLREVLGAYRLKGDGDREMLLAILNAKAAEDQRIAAMAQLHQTILQVTSSNLLESVQLAPLAGSSNSGGGGGLGVGLGHSSHHSHSPGMTTSSMDSSSPPTRSQLMSISSLIGGATRRSSSTSGSRSPTSVGTSGDHGRSHRLSSERTTS